MILRGLKPTPKICQYIGEDYNMVDYIQCIECTKFTCPINHLQTRIDALERLALIPSPSEAQELRRKA